MKKLYPFILRAFVFFGAGIGTALFLLARQNWFGSGDLNFFICWSVPLLFLIFGVQHLLSGHVRHLGHLAQVGVFTIAGVGLAFGFTLGLMTMTGPWWGAVSFSVFICWLIAVPLAMTVPVMKTVKGLMLSALVIALSIGAFKTYNDVTREPPQEMFISFKERLDALENNQMFTYIRENSNTVAGIGGNDPMHISFAFGTTVEEAKEFQAFIVQHPLVKEARLLSQEEIKQRDEEVRRKMAEWKVVK